MARTTAQHISLERGMAILASGLNPDGTPYQLPVMASNAATVAVGEQRFFWAGSGRVALTAAGNMRAVIQNPANSERRVLLARLTTFASAGPAWAEIIVNPTTGVPTVAPRRVNNAVIGATGGVATVRVDTDLMTPLGGGTSTGVVIGIPGNTRVSLDLPPLVLMPGVTIGINDAFAGAADATLTVFWWEEAI